MTYSIVLKIPSLLLSDRGKYNYRSQTTSCHIQKRCSYIITEVSVNSIKYRPIQSENNIEVWARPIHSGLAVQTKSQ